MKKSLFYFCILIFFSLSFSCVTKPVPIPGDKKNAIDNIYLEYMNIADVYYSLEKYDKALEYYKLAMQDFKIYWAAYYKTAKVYAVQSNWDSALPMYRRLLRREKDNASIKASIAYIYAMTGSLKKAERAYKELVFLQPDNREYLENLIAVYFARQHYEEGRTRLEILIEKFPDSENIQKFKDVLKAIDDENSAEIPLDEEDGDKSVFEEELENPDLAESDQPPAPEKSKSKDSTAD